ncbi:MAG: Fe-S cluster assembly protein HesB [Deltaproteobacteria bacterium]|jgi:iron-sulfur cluster assembly protein|nr:Fe-S cluster assembly protein HesB [Deltaproteobacteria bacterium]
MFEISDLAADQIKLSEQQLDDKDLRLRISARKTEDHEISYKMGFDNFYDIDIKLDINGVKVVLDTDSENLIKGMLIDYQELDGKEQIVFLNPNDPFSDKDTEK